LGKRAGDPGKGEKKTTPATKKELGNKEEYYLLRRWILGMRREPWTREKE